MFYEHGEKCGKLLSHQIKWSAASCTIPEICTAPDVLTDPEAINLQFKKIYTSLYISGSPMNPSHMNNFLDETHSKNYS